MHIVLRADTYGNFNQEFESDIILVLFEIELRILLADGDAKLGEVLVVSLITDTCSNEYPFIVNETNLLKTGDKYVINKTINCLLRGVFKDIHCSLKRAVRRVIPLQDSILLLKLNHSL